MSQRLLKTPTFGYRGFALATEVLLALTLFTVLGVMGHAGANARQ